MQNLHEVLERYRAIAIFLTLAVVISVLFVSICYSARTVMRQAANDPQIEVTDQVTNIVRQGVPIDAIVSGAEQIDMASSKALFVMIFDNNRTLVGSSAQLEGEAPTAPSEAFDKAGTQADYRFDWEPRPGVKVAAIMKQIDDDAYVLAGRSLAEFETRTQTLKAPLWIGWAISMLLALLLAALVRPMRSVAIIEETNVTVVEATDQD
ncbi:MAG TPA: hypothetical protein PKD79_03470 [Candidatus Doudnabacteria bacterium]|nr:hypothetical protein [Candidatus Doudnabacteria bacterium]